MIKYVLPAALLVLVAGGIPSAEAGFVSGTDLLDICSPPRIDPVYRLKVAQCRGYVIGVADTFDCRTSVVGFTWDSRTTANQEALVNVVVKWLHDNPGSLRYQANGLVAAALSTEFPCSRAETKN